MKSKSVKIKSIQNNVAIIQIINPPVNAFSSHVHEDFKIILEKCYSDDNIIGCIITGDGKNFIAGADIMEINELTKSEPNNTKDFLKRGHELYNMIENGPKPCIAAINGICLGGGCELAMCCCYRIGIISCKIGLPEVQLGLLPGLGGTQRCPRLIGFEMAMKIILTSKILSSNEAKEYGLIDKIVNSIDELMKESINIIQNIHNNKQKRRYTCKETNFLLNNKISIKENLDIISSKGQDTIKKRSPGIIDIATRVIDAMKVGVYETFEKGIEKELEYFVTCVHSLIGRSMQHYFLASKSTTKLYDTIKPSINIQYIGVIGGGTMGAGITVCFLQKNIPVILKEINNKMLQAGIQRILNILQKYIEQKKLSKDTIEKIMRNLLPQTTYDNFNKVNLVIEAVIENLSLKKKIFQEIIQYTNKNTIVATNTSTLDLNNIIDIIPDERKEYFIGTHFFSPAHIMPLLEIIITTNTNKNIISSILYISKRIGKISVISKTCTGFIANRMFMGYAIAASTLVLYGIHPYKIDKALLKFGMPMGIFYMNDSVGLDICKSINIVFTSSYSDRLPYLKLIDLFVNNNRLGIKNKQGFYIYKENSTKPLHEKSSILDTIFDEFRQSYTNLSHDIFDSIKNFTDDDIISTTLYVVVNEACRILQEGVARNIDDIDIVSCMGYGFPRYRGGILYWAINDKTLSRVEKTLTKLQNLFSKHPDPIFSKFFAPSSALRNMI